MVCTCLFVCCCLLFDVIDMPLLHSFYYLLVLFISYVLLILFYVLYMFIYILFFLI